VREYEDELARKVVLVVDNALPEAVREAVGDGAMTADDEAMVAGVERGISVAASLAASYLGVGWTVELFARGLHVPGGNGRHHEARLARALALLPYVGDEVGFADLPLRVESVLIAPRAVPALGRPPATTVMDV